MKIYSPLWLALRMLFYGLVLFGMAEGVFYDAGHPLGISYFGEITFTEISQEVILFILAAFFMFLGWKWREAQTLSILVSLFLLMSFIREFNFLIEKWIYPVSVVAVIFIVYAIRNFKKIKPSFEKFFSVPASAWFLSGFLTTYVFSRLMGRSKFWRLMYEGENYRLAKAATEEGIELLGNTLMLFAAVEFAIWFWSVKKTK